MGNFGFPEKNETCFDELKITVFWVMMPRGFVDG